MRKYRDFSPNTEILVHEATNKLDTPVSDSQMVEYIKAALARLDELDAKDAK